MSLDALRLDLDEKVPRIRYTDIHAPRPVRPVLLLIDRVDAFQRARETNAGPAQRLDCKDSARQIAAGVGSTASVKEVTVAGWSERIIAGPVPFRRISGRIGIEVIIENEYLAVRSNAR